MRAHPAGRYGANADAYTVGNDAALDVDASRGVLANDPAASTLGPHAVLVDAPSHGTLDLLPDGSFHYTPTPAFEGTDTFVYRIETAAGSSRMTLVSIKVTEPPPPTITPTPEPTSTPTPTATPRGRPTPTPKLTSTPKPTAHAEANADPEAHGDAEAHSDAETAQTLREVPPATS